LLEAPVSDPVQLIKQSQTDALEENLSEATTALYQGLKNLGNHAYADALYKDFYDIMSDNDRKAFKKARDRGQFLFQFWQKQDPTPATLENERYLEHWKRLEYVKQYFFSPEERGYDDRGMIYLRYGPPDDRTEMAHPRALYANECWVYRRFGSEVVFDFIRRAISYNLALDLTKIAPLQSKELIYEQIFEFTEPRMDMSLQYAALGSKVLSKLNEKVTPRVAQAANTQEGRQAEAGAEPLTTENIQAAIIDLQQIHMENIAEQTRLPHVATGLRRSENPLQGSIASARFLRQDKTQLEIYFGIPVQQFADEKINRKTDLDIAYAIRDTAYNLLVQKNLKRTIQVPASTSAQHRVYIDQINEILSPGSYTFSLEMKNTQTGKALEKGYNIEIHESSRANLLLSDIEFAHNIQPVTGLTQNAAFVKFDLSILPYPSYSIASRTPINLYFEVYNLLLDPSGKTSYEVEYQLHSTKSGLIEKITSGQDVALSSSYIQEGNQRDTQEYFSLDFGKVKPGKYALIVQVTDKVARVSESSEVRLEVIEQ